MRFADPVFLVLAAVAAAALASLFVALAGARRRALAQIGSPRLLPGLTASLSRRRRLLKQALLVLGVALLGVALARPQLGYRWEDAHRRGVDLLFAIDTSRSMLTRDVKPDRLERAKLAVRSLVERFPDDRVGLVAFAGDAFVETPLTLDRGIFDESVASLDTHVIALGGTDIASAIRQADKALSGDTHRKVLVVLTDGEDLSGDALGAAKQAATDGVVIYAVGVGTPNGELIPVPGPDGQTQFVRDEKGELVTSRLDEGLLARIARATGGDYRLLGDGGQGLESLYRDELSKLPRSDLASRSMRVPIERYQWPLGLGLLLLGVEPLVGERRRRRAPSSRVGHPGRRGAAVAAAGLAGVLVAPGASASPQSAQRAYQAGDFAAAEQGYAVASQAAPRDPRLSFNLGAAAYKKGDYERADKAFESTLRSDDLGLQEQAYYNLGNASFRLGEAALSKDDVEATKGRWKQSVDEYEGALRLRPDDADARYNLDLVRRRLADLEKKQQEKKDQEQKQQQQKDRGVQGSKDQSAGAGQGQKDPKQSGGPGAQQDANPKAGKPPGEPRPGADQGNGEGKQGGRQDPGDAKSAKSEGARAQQGQPPETPGDDRAGPGELSKKDAEALLDSLRGDLKVSHGAPSTVQAAQAREPRKDW